MVTAGDVHLAEMSTLPSFNSDGAQPSGLRPTGTVGDLQTLDEESSFVQAPLVVSGSSRKVSIELTGNDFFRRVRAPALSCCRMRAR
jgi:hypothetical protein